jgi:hypothetical protein
MNKGNGNSEKAGCIRCVCKQGITCTTSLDCLYSSAVSLLDRVISGHISTWAVLCCALGGLYIPCKQVLEIYYELMKTQGCILYSGQITFSSLITL